MKKLLFINGHLNTGGVEKSLLDVLKHLDHTCYDVDLLLLEDLGDFVSELHDHVHVDLRCLKNTYGPLPKCLLRCIRQRDWFCFRMRLIFLLMKLFGQKKICLAKKILTGNKHYDCVIGFRPGICTQIAAFAVNADRRITWWHHGEINVEHTSYLEAASACDQVAVVSESCHAMLAGAFPSLENKLAVVPNMLDMEAVRKKAEAFRPYAQRSVFHIVTLCRLSPEKRIENAIFAAQKLKAAGIAFLWHLVGGGSIILPDFLAGAAAVCKPAHFGVANAIGSAISKVSGTCDCLADYQQIPREQAMAQAREKAVELAVEAGAVRETVEIMEAEDIPLAYHPGNTCRIKVKAAGDLA